MVVMALVAVAVSLVTLSLRDPASAQLDREAVRLAALLETARAESRSSGVPLRFVLPTQSEDTGFRFVGLRPSIFWNMMQSFAPTKGLPRVVQWPCAFRCAAIRSNDQPSICSFLTSGTSGK